MLVLLLLAVSVAGLALGVTTNEVPFFVGSLAASLLAAALMVQSRRTLVEGPADVEAPGVPTADPAVESADQDETVVFVPGRTTFHRAGCPAVGERPTSSALRAQLEAGGMSACRRCAT